MPLSNPQALRDQLDPDFQRPSPYELPRLRRCPSCQVAYDLSEQWFYLRRHRAPHQLCRFFRTCKECTRAQQKARTAATKDARNAAARRRRAKLREARRKHGANLGILTLAERQAGAAPDLERKHRETLGHRKLLDALGPKPDAVKAKIKVSMAEAVRRSARRVLENLEPYPR